MAFGWLSLLNFSAHVLSSSSFVYVFGYDDYRFDKAGFVFFTGKSMIRRMFS